MPFVCRKPDNTEAYHILKLTKSVMYQTKVYNYFTLQFIYISNLLVLVITLKSGQMGKLNMGIN